MASKIGIIFVLAAVSTLQEVEPSPISSFEHRLEKGIKTAVAEVEVLIRTVESSFEKIINKIKEDIEDAYSVASKTIKKAEEEAKAVGVGFMECTKTAWNEIEQERNTTMRKAEECVDIAREVIDRDVESAWEAIESIGNTGRSAIHNITACHQNIACLSNAAVKGEIHFNQKILDFGKTIPKIQKEVPEATINAAQCGNVALNTAMSQIHKIATSAVQCIRDNINSHSS